MRGTPARRREGHDPPTADVQRPLPELVPERPELLAADGETAAARAADAIAEVIAAGGASRPFTYPCETPRGTRWFVMTTHLDGGERLVLVVEDDGPGIPEEQRDRVLRAFERAGSRAEGSGLGLSIVSRFTSLLGGDLTVGERPGGGARFTVDVPVTTTEGDGATAVR